MKHREKVARADASALVDYLFRHDGWSARNEFIFADRKLPLLLWCVGNRVRFDAGVLRSERFETFAHGMRQQTRLCLRICDHDPAAKCEMFRSDTKAAVVGFGAVGIKERPNLRGWVEAGAYLGAASRCPTGRVAADDRGPFRWTRILSRSRNKP